jgi:hypothetical protein
MRNYHGGDKVSSGFYFNQKTWTLESVSGKAGGVLPGGEPYLRLPSLLMLLAGPVLGASLVLFLPFAGLYLFMKTLAQKIIAFQPLAFRRKFAYIKK